MKRLVSIMVVLAFCLSAPSVMAYERIPDSVSYNGILPDGTSIYENDLPEKINVPQNQEVSPLVFIGYNYVPGYEELKNRTYVHEYAYIWGTSVNFDEGASPYYKVSTRRWTTEENEWNIRVQGSGDFDIKAVKANLQIEGGYRNTEIASIEVNEEWYCEFDSPGLYELTWYMRGHKYDAYCGGEYITTDMNDGRFTKVYLGTVTFATKEIHFDISKI